MVSDMLDPRDHPRFCAARRRAIALEFSGLNPQQQEGVLATEGPLLLLAGAGSGKTTVLINRIANILRFGRGSDSAEIPDWITEEDLTFLENYQGSKESEPGDVLRAEELCALDPARPWEVIAITFTNKAAGELKQRLENQIGLPALDVWAATFHSACVRILRRNIERLGLPSSFTIYDSDDSVRVMKECLKVLNLDDKTFPPRTVLGYISRAKDEMLLAEDYAARCKAQGDYRLMKVANLYLEYERRLWSAGALDFDDIILHTVRILQQFSDVREYYQRKFRYVLIDEYQDTNHLQYLLATLLAGGRKNFCVVGDDDQSIYRFRGATIENILSFESEYQGARVIRLEQNYRSTGHILEAANAVIRNNGGRKGKNLWTDHGMGDQVQVYNAQNEQDEALHVAAQILRSYGSGRQWKDHAILYRMNAQSNQLEMALKRNSIPYRVIGGFRFFERAEVKDMLAYLCVIHNPLDDLRLTRIINNPPRGIGAKTLETAQTLAAQEGISLWEVVSQADQYPILAKSAPKFQKFSRMLQTLSQMAEEISLPALYDQLLAESGYLVMLEEKQTVENKSRRENVTELKSSITGYLENAEDPTLGGFLDEVALYTDLDSQEDSDNCVTMMTMHAAKGLEFPVVFAVGMEEGLFPGFRAIGEQEELEEERRLCYVAMTRAKEQLHLSCAAQRMLFGRTAAYMPSRFLREIPEEYLAVSGRNYAAENHDSFESQWTRPTREAEGFAASQTASGPGDQFYYTEKPAKRRVASYRSPAPKSAPLPDFSKGDMVRHTAFGEGMILSVQPMGGDALLEVAFDNVGTKRLMLKAAAQHMKKQ